MIVSTPLSLSRAGRSCCRFSAMNPLSCCAAAETVSPDLVQRGALRPQLRQQRIGVLHQADHLVGALGQHSRRFGGVVEQLAQVGIAFVERLREPGHTLHRGPHLFRGVGEGLRQGGERIR